MQRVWKLIGFLFFTNQSGVRFRCILCRCIHKTLERLWVGVFPCCNVLSFYRLGFEHIFCFYRWWIEYRPGWYWFFSSSFFLWLLVTSPPTPLLLEKGDWTDKDCVIIIFNSFFKFLVFLIYFSLYFLLLLLCSLYLPFIFPLSSYWVGFLDFWLFDFLIVCLFVLYVIGTAFWTIL